MCHQSSWCLISQITSVIHHQTVVFCKPWLHLCNDQSNSNSREVRLHCAIHFISDKFHSSCCLVKLKMYYFRSDTQEVLLQKWYSSIEAWGLPRVIHTKSSLDFTLCPLSSCHNGHEYIILPQSLPLEEVRHFMPRAMNRLNLIFDHLHCLHSSQVKSQTKGAIKNLQRRADTLTLLKESQIGRKACDLLFSWNVEVLTVRDCLMAPL